LREVLFDFVSISRPTVFVTRLKELFDDANGRLPFDTATLERFMAEVKGSSAHNSSLANEKRQLEAKALGCTACCPYCQKKCTEPTNTPASTHKHQCNHRIAGFGLSLMRSGTRFVTDVCSSRSNFASFWM
jgi:hypothetical protein